MHLQPVLHYIELILHFSTFIITPCACARGKVIDLYVCCRVLAQKIARSRDIGI